MKFWDYLKFFAMLIPTWMLLGALALTLAAAAKGNAPSSVEPTVLDRVETVVADTELGPVPTVVAR
jgi:hypothetical protein